MKVIMTTTGIGGTELSQVNYCRLFLKAELISDIITADGKAIRRGAWLGDAPIVDQGSHQKWTQQPRPSAKAWQLWRRTLQQVLQTNSEGKLQHALPIRCRLLMIGVGFIMKQLNGSIKAQKQIYTNIRYFEKAGIIVLGLKRSDSGVWF
jgi:hypothetical protein